MRKYPRRRFIQKSVLLLGGISYGACGASSPEAPPRTEPENSVGSESNLPTDAPAPGLFVARQDQIPIDSVRYVSLQGQPVLVMNDGGEIRALSGICSHEQCEVEWRSDLGVLQCPCHDGRFDKRGQVISGPPPSPLRELKVILEEGRVYLPEG